MLEFVNNGVSVLRSTGQYMLLLVSLQNRYIETRHGFKGITTGHGQSGARLALALDLDCQHMEHKCTEDG